MWVLSKNRSTSVFELFLSIFLLLEFFIQGNRATVPARIGQTLMEAALQHKIDIEGPCGGGGAPTQSRRTESWVETTWGEGPSCFFCHVQIASKYNSVLPEIFEHERKGIADIWDDEYTRNSRLACKIRLDARHDGMVVYVPDSPVADCIWSSSQNTRTVTTPFVLDKFHLCWLLPVSPLSGEASHRMMYMIWTRTVTNLWFHLNLLQFYLEVSQSYNLYIDLHSRTQSDLISLIAICPSNWHKLESFVIKATLVHKTWSGSTQSMSRAELHISLLRYNQFIKRSSWYWNGYTVHWLPNQKYEDRSTQKASCVLSVS